MSPSDPVPGQRGGRLGPVIAVAGGVLAFLMSVFLRQYREITVPLSVFLLAWGIVWGLYLAFKSSGR